MVPLEYIFSDSIFNYWLPNSNIYRISCDFVGSVESCLRENEEMLSPIPTRKASPF